MSLARKLLLAMSTNAWLRDRATKTAFVRRSVSTFMPGERLEDAMAAASPQQAAGGAAEGWAPAPGRGAGGAGMIYKKRGENATRGGGAEEVPRHYLDVLDRIDAAGLDAQISVKPTQLGLDLDTEFCFANLQRLVE